MSTNFGRAPAVFSREIDLTNTVLSVNTTEGAIAGIFNWGPVEQRVLINSETTYAAVFGAPSNLNPETWFSGANFLTYSDALYVVRAANTTGMANNITNTVTTAVASNAAVSNTILLSSIVKNPITYDDISFNAAVPFVAKYPGELGNSLRISVCASSAAFSKVVGLVANSDVSSESAVVYTPGSNTAIVTITASGTGNANTVIAAAALVTADLTPGDVVRVGNTSIGTQFLSITSVGAAAIVGTTATMNVQFSSSLTLFEAVTSNSIERFWEFYNVVDGAPDVSLYQAKTNNPTITDEMHVVIIDKDGKFTGTPNAILEVFGAVSRATDARTDDGTSNYYKNALNQTSKYVWSGADLSGVVTGVATALVAPVQPKAATMNFAQGQNGEDEATVPIAVLARAWDLFKSADEVQTSYLIQGKARDNTLANYLIGSIAEVRQDTVAVISPPKSAVVNANGAELANLIAFRRSLQSTSYAMLDSNFKYQYDKYNDVYRWIPLSGDVAGILARSASGTAPWMSPGGYSRGRVRNTIRLAWTPDQPNRDALYREDINPLYNVTGQGAILMGDKTLIGKNSAFSRINVRQLFILLRKNISTASADLLFEINDEFAQAQFRNMIEPLLRDIQGRRGITAYTIVCDERNNTPQVIDNHGFAGDIYVTPARSINTIQLNFAGTRTGVDFTEVIGTF